uniref:YrhK domain-containing protein n=1 Tax=Chromera velia CCMP2878 TaxID=1169474 RepID=A0A0G4ICV0_9ALVE|eukprot:Cvel_13229.t1-p1 / transcript=Cvel_13229.t1 / gene=Cvel_13229 / organism=Chromera_velia_CCMP2878 / gene_product=hypothetical protein / transcript_product=hypothetical protein / location=Cvel_scaffold896:10964-11497(-) / protein_length=178 / sequence_SO=supercontig / SO=protein_coding / is_pseudo=false
MLMGGILFETASILYWPSFNTARIGTWTFRIGSFFYLGGSVSSFVMIYSAPIAETSRGDHEEDAATATDLGDEEAAGESLRAEEGGGPARPSCCISVSKHLSRRGHSIASVLFPVNHLAALAGTWAFVIGALLYIAGGVMSEFNLASVTAFALTWGVASCFFVVGSAIFFCKELMEKT